MILLLMGVTGSGKSTLGTLLAHRLRWSFVEADDFHSSANKEKMRAGIPLTDADRKPWLDAIHAELMRRDQDEVDTILACSALRARYRKQLSKGLNVKVVYLKGSQELIGERLRARIGHFAGESILADQFATLEEPADAWVVDVAGSPEEAVESVLLKVKASGPARLSGQLLRKLRWRLLLFLFLLYVVAYLDRINVAFAALQMKDQLRLSDAVYGFGGGIFFLGYFLFQVPSNLVLERAGARRCIAALMVMWGVVSSSMMLIHSAHSFYALRFLLGAAEAGFFPGVIYYLRSWFPASARAGVVALFMTAGPVAGVVGGPISGALLDWNHLGGLAGWQWMFLIEGIPAILLGALAFVYLIDRPEEAGWLTESEKQSLRQSLQVQSGAKELAPREERWWALLPVLCGFAVVYFGLNVCVYGVGLWLPSALKSLGSSSNILIGFLSAVPYLAAATAMVIVGAHSDHTLERRWHVALAAFIGAAALVGAGYSGVIGLSVAGFGIALAASFSMAGPFWAMVSATLSAETAAGGIALINALGNLGGGFGPYWVGYLRGITGSFRGGLLSVALFMTISGFTILLLSRGSSARTS